MTCGQASKKDPDVEACWAHTERAAAVWAGAVSCSAVEVESATAPELHGETERQPARYTRKRERRMEKQNTGAQRRRGETGPKQEAQGAIQTDEATSEVPLLPCCIIAHPAAMILMAAISVVACPR